MIIKRSRIFSLLFTNISHNETENFLEEQSNKDKKFFLF